MITAKMELRRTVIRILLVGEKPRQARPASRGEQAKKAYASRRAESSLADWLPTAHCSHNLNIPNDLQRSSPKTLPGAVFVKWRNLVVAAALLFAACKDSSGPSARNVSLAPNGGTDQFGAVNNQLAEPLQVIVTDPVTKRTLERITVTWKVVQGAGASVSPVTSVTGADGVA